MAFCNFQQAQGRARRFASTLFPTDFRIAGNAQFASKNSLAYAQFFGASGFVEGDFLLMT